MTAEAIAISNHKGGWGSPSRAVNPGRRPILGLADAARGLRRAGMLDQCFRRRR